MDGGGTLCVYGWRDGVLCNGEVEPEVIDRVPDGSWDGSPCIVSLRGVDVEGEHGERIKELCNKLTALTLFEDDCYEIDDGKLCFNPYCFNMKDADCFARFAELVGELVKLCKGNGIIQLFPHFWDCAEDKLRTVSFDFTEDGSYCMRLYELPKGKRKYLNGEGCTSSDKIASVMISYGVRYDRFIEYKLTQEGNNLKVLWEASELCGRNRREGDCVLENKSLAGLLKRVNSAELELPEVYDIGYSWKVLCLDGDGNVTGGFESGEYDLDAFQEITELAETYLGEDLFVELRNIQADDSCPRPF